MGRHSQEAVHLHGGDVHKEVIQLVVGILSGIEQVAVQLDVKRAVFFCVGHLVRRGQLIGGRVGGQAVCKSASWQAKNSPLRDEKVDVRTDALIAQGVKPAAKLPLDHDRVQSRSAELAIEVGKFRQSARSGSAPAR